MLQYVVEKFIFSLCWLDTVAITIFPAICAKIQCIRNWKLNKTEMQDYIINDEIKKKQMMNPQKMQMKKEMYWFCLKRNPSA